MLSSKLLTWCEVPTPHTYGSRNSNWVIIVESELQVLLAYCQLRPH